MTKYPKLVRIIHWLMAAIIICLIVSGLTLQFWPKEFKPQFYYWHKSFGILILILVLLRVNLRLKNLMPPYPDKFSRFIVLSAKLWHLALYALMFTMPISGYVMSMAGGYGVSVFGFQMVDLIGKNKELGEIAYNVHDIAADFLLIMIIIHVSAVIKHAIIDKENLLKRMW